MNRRRSRKEVRFVSLFVRLPERSVDWRHQSKSSNREEKCERDDKLTRRPFAYRKAQQDIESDRSKRFLPMFRDRRKTDRRFFLLGRIWELPIDSKSIRFPWNFCRRKRRNESFRVRSNRRENVFLGGIDKKYWSFVENGWTRSRLPTAERWNSEDSWRKLSHSWIVSRKDDSVCKIQKKISSKFLFVRREKDIVRPTSDFALPFGCPLKRKE